MARRSSKNGLQEMTLGARKRSTHGKWGPFILVDAPFRAKRKQNPQIRILHWDYASFLLANAQVSCFFSMLAVPCSQLDRIPV